MKLGTILTLIIAICIIVAYALLNWQRYGTFWGKRGFENVELVNLISFSALYDGKTICTKGYVIEGNNSTFIKTGVSGSRFEGSAWLINNTGRSFIFNTSNLVTKAVMARVCGSFQSKRDGEFGNPPFWRHQLTINEFSGLGAPFAVEY